MTIEYWSPIFMAIAKPIRKDLIEDLISPVNRAGKNPASRYLIRLFYCVRYNVLDFCERGHLHPLPKIFLIAYLLGLDEPITACLNFKFFDEQHKVESKFAEDAGILLLYKLLITIRLALNEF